MEKKKILFFHFDLNGGGAEKVLVNLVNNLDRDKYDITVQTIFGVGPHINNLSPHIHYKSFFKKQFFGFTKLQRLFSPRLLHKIFIKGKYDLEIAYLETSPTRIVAGCTTKETKLMAWVHITLHEFPWFRNRDELKKVYSKYNKVVCVSNDVQDAFISASGIRELPFYVQRNVVDSDFILSKANEFNDLKVDVNKINICFIGRFVPAKDPLRLIRTLNNINNRGYQTWHLYFLGTGELERDIRDYLARNNLNDNVTFLGYQMNPYKYIKLMDLYVCSSHEEGYSTAATEALILGIPVFTTNCGGMEEILDNGKYGVIVPDNDSDFENGLEDLLKNREKYLHYKEMAKIRGSFFRKETILKENENLIDSVLNEK